MTGTIIACYAAIGALFATGTYFAVDHGIQHREGDPELDAAMDEIERPLKGMPGGMAVLLLAIVVFWPALVATLGVNFLRARTRG